jgi:hypothetical protein
VEKPLIFSAHFQKKTFLNYPVRNNMKIKIRQTNIIYYLLFGISIFCFVIQVSAQSGNKETKVPIQEITVPVEDKSKDEIKKPKAEYEFISPRNIYYFMLALKEAGRRGFKLDKLTSLPGVGIEVDNQKLIGTVMAGTVKFDGVHRYDYNFFFGEGEKDPELTLNRLAKDGWALREVISINNSGNEENLPTGDIFANQLKNFPLLGNFYLLERPDGEKVVRSYKLFKAGVGTGRNPSPKLQEMMDGAIAEGYLPVASYTSFAMTGFLKIDAFSGIIVEKREAPKKLEYKFIRGNSSEGMWQDLDAAAKQGFRIESMSFSTAILTREPGATAPVSYTWLFTDDKKYQTNLTATLAKNPYFHSAGVFSFPRGPMNKNLLIFENPATPVNEELKLVTLIPIIPKEFKKKPDEFYKTIDLPAVIFQKTLDAGFVPRDVYYSDGEGLMMVFARAKK